MKLSPRQKGIIYSIAEMSMRAAFGKREPVITWPPVESSKELDDLIPRLAFHFPSKERIIVTRKHRNIKPTGERPNYLADSLSQFRSQIQFLTAGQKNFFDIFTKADRLLLLGDPDKVSFGRFLKYLPNVAPFDSRYISMVSFWTGKFDWRESKKEEERSREEFNSYVSSLPKKEKVYLLCTGPSLASYRDFDFSDGYVVGCNSIVSNGELLESVRPEFMVACDPIYHFGPSVYAEQFLRDLSIASKNYSFKFLTLSDYAGLVRRHEILDNHRVFYLPNLQEGAVLDVSESWGVGRTSNILTMFMLPLAAALAKDIYIIGADGGKPEGAGFWKHDPSSQLSDKMQAIRDCHPAFFEQVSLSDYYDQHCKTLKNQIAGLEDRGYRVSSLTPSHIPSLKERYKC